MASLISRVLACVLLFLPVISPSSATTHTVDWSLGTDYTSLTSSNSFTVGDTLVFNYGVGHTVDEVTQSDYTSCTVGNSISSDSSGSTSVTLKTSGPHFFICAAPGHCSAGMKLSVAVASAAAGDGTSPAAGGGDSSSTTATPTTSSGGATTIPGTTTTTTTTGSVYTPASYSASVAVSPAFAALAATWVAVAFVCFGSFLGC